MAAIGIEAADPTGASWSPDTGDIGPADASVKVAHHAHDHKNVSSNDKHSQENKKMVADKFVSDPHAYGMYHAKNSAKNGGLMLTLFTSLFIVIKQALHSAYAQLTHASEAISLIPSLELAVVAPLAAAVTGAAWYGIRDYMKHKSAAQDHNQELEAKLHGGQDLSRGQEKALERERAIDGRSSLTEADDELEQGSVSFQGIESGLLANKERPTYLSQILKSGPQSLSPGDLAERIAQERATAQESART